VCGDLAASTVMDRWLSREDQTGIEPESS